VVIRPEHVELSRPGEGGNVDWPRARVTRVVESGEVTRYTVDIGGAKIRCLGLGLRQHASGEQVAVTLKRDGPVIVPNSQESG